jgi:hypothetical protein
MARRAVRLLLLVLLAGGLGGAAYVAVVNEQQIAAKHSAARDFDSTSAIARDRVADVRTGQQAYVAAGQSEAWWKNRVHDQSEMLDADLGDLLVRATDASSRREIDAARDASAAVTEVDLRIRRLLADGEKGRAAALVFSEGLEASGAISRHLEAARMAELQAADRAAARLRWSQRYAAGGAALLSLAVALLLLPASTRRDEYALTAPAATGWASPASLAREAAPEFPPVPAEVIPPVAASPLDEFRPSSEFSAPVASEARTTEGAPPRPDRRKAPELRAAADLCTDFARLMDGDEMPSLLERAARLLDATGLIIWVIDGEGGALRPMLAHGYSASALARLPAIPRDSDNATASAYRDARIEIVKTNGMSPGAIVAPLLSPAGCIGVMAAEVRHGREASESARALARIVAAQLATLVSVTPPRTAHEAHTAVS